MLVLFIALGVLLGILGWKAAEAGAKIFLFLVVVSGVVWLVGFLLQNPLLLVLCIMAVIYMTLAIRGAPRRRSVEEQGSGHVPSNIAAQAIGRAPSIAFAGYHSPWHNPLNMKHFVVAKESNAIWLINFDPFSYEIVKTYQVPINDISVEVKNRLLGNKVIIKTPNKKIVLDTNKQGGQEARKLSDAALLPDPKAYSEEELQRILYAPPQELAGRLKQWQQDPNSQPEIEYHYRNYTMQGKALPRPLPKWEEEAEDYIPRLNKALSLEKTGGVEEALKIYLDIIEQYNARGTAYYERPAIILEKMGRLEQAISVCEKALGNPYLQASQDSFEKRLNRLQKKRNKKKN